MVRSVHTHVTAITYVGNHFEFSGIPTYLSAKPSDIDSKKSKRIAAELCALSDLFAWTCFLYIFALLEQTGQKLIKAYLKSHLLVTNGNLRRSIKLKIRKYYYACKFYFL